MNKLPIGFIGFCILVCGIVFSLIFSRVILDRVAQKNTTSINSNDRFEDRMMTTSFSANVVEEYGTIAKILSETNGISQVRVSYGSKSYEAYALAPMPVTNSQPVKVIGVTARHSEAPGVLPSFTRLAIPY